MNVGGPIFMKDQRLQVGMALDVDAVEIVQFALIPGGRRGDGGSRADRAFHPLAEQTVLPVVHIDDVVHAPGAIVFDAAENRDQAGVAGSEERQCFAYAGGGSGAAANRVHCSTAIALCSTEVKAAGMRSPRISRQTPQMHMAAISEASGLELGAAPVWRFAAQHPLAVVEQRAEGDGKCHQHEQRPAGNGTG